MPSSDYASEIQKIAEDILRISYIKEVPNLTSEEKKVVEEIASSLESKTAQLEQVIVKSYANGMLVYLYNASIMTAQNAATVIKEAEQKMYGNIYTKRLGGSLKDSMALQLLKVNQNQLQKCNWPATRLPVFRYHRTVHWRPVTRHHRNDGTNGIL